MPFAPGFKKGSVWAALLCTAVLLAAGCGGKEAGTAPAQAPAPAAKTEAPALPTEVVAHRGGKPENTLGAFRKALATPEVGAIELDVQVSKDGELFIMHDTTVDRTTNGKGAVADLTAEQIRQLATKEGSEPVPTLDQVLAEVARAPGKRVFVEIKGPTPADTPDKVVAAIKKNGVADRATVVSFDRDLVDAVKKLDPKQPTGFISKKFDKDEMEYPGEYLFITSSVVTKEKVEQAQKTGKKVYVWTVDDKLPMERFLLLHVDGIITNEYPLLIQVKQASAK